MKQWSSWDLYHSGSHEIYSLRHYKLSLNSNKWCKLEQNMAKCTVVNNFAKYINSDECLYLIVDGEWSNWKAWSTCSSTCGDSYKMRIRACDNPAPAYGGLECSGSSYELQTCPFIHCPGQFLVTNFLYSFYSVL